VDVRVVFAQGEVQECGGVDVQEACAGAGRRSSGTFISPDFIIEMTFDRGKLASMAISRWVSGRRLWLA
jgi:hypothetical protein